MTQTNQEKIDWKGFFRQFKSASDEEMIEFIWGKCFDMGSSDGALMSVKRVPIFTEGILSWHKEKLTQATEEARKEGERSMGEKIVKNYDNKIKECQTEGLNVTAKLMVDVRDIALEEVTK